VNEPFPFVWVPYVHRPLGAVPPLLLLLLPLLLLLLPLLELPLAPPLELLLLLLLALLPTVPPLLLLLVAPPLELLAEPDPPPDPPLESSPLDPSPSRSWLVACEASPPSASPPTKPPFPAPPQASRREKGSASCNFPLIFMRLAWVGLDRSVVAP
jgi:hypothetical protein